MLIDEEEQILTAVWKKGGSLSLLPIIWHDDLVMMSYPLIFSPPLAGQETLAKERLTLWISHPLPTSLKRTWASPTSRWSEMSEYFYRLS